LFGFEGNGGKQDIFAYHHTAVPEIIMRFVAACEVAARIRGDLRNEPGATEVNALILTDIGVAEDQIGPPRLRGYP